MSLGTIVLLGAVTWAVLATIVTLVVGRMAKARDAEPPAGGPRSSRPRSRDTVIHLTRQDDEAS